MRQLPEIETLRRELDREIGGRKIKEVAAASMSLLPRYPNRKAFTSRLEGVKVQSVARRALYLLASLDSDELLVFDLGQHGRLRRNQAKEPEEAGTEIVFSFTQGPQLRIVDATGEAEVFLTTADELGDALPELANLGFDPLESVLSWVNFGELVVAQQRELKHLFTDSSVIVGLGDVYADEVLFEAGLRYDRRSDTLSTQEIRRLYRALVEILHDAVKHRGTTLDGDDFTDLAGEPGGYGDLLQVYGREGQLSPRSRAPIRKVKFGGTWTYYCDTQV